MSDYILSVSQVNAYANSLISDNPLLKSLFVSGEVSNFKRHSSGHLYFVLKDETALIRCVMFRQSAMRLDFSPADGMQVVAGGSVRIYEKDGQYQLYVSEMTRQGAGDLYRRFLELKDRLEKRGLFDSARKRPIPYLPKCIGIVTSPTGAALHDMFSVIGRRFPTMNIMLYPAKVQGDGAAETIIKGIDSLNASGEPDVIIIGRGGGSIEDLWAFNDEQLAEAIYRSPIPIVSAVGHETDYSISDFVADVRAATPSAAAELCVPSFDSLVGKLTSMREGMLAAAKSRISFERRRAEGAIDPMIPLRNIDTLRLRTDRAGDSVTSSAAAYIKARRAGLAEISAALGSLDPDAVLKRGYAVVFDASGKAVSSAHELNIGEQVWIQLADGEADATVNAVNFKEVENV